MGPNNIFVDHPDMKQANWIYLATVLRLSSNLAGKKSPGLCENYVQMYYWIVSTPKKVAYIHISAKSLPTEA